MNTYEKRKQKGVCTRCAIEPPLKDKTLCEGCRIYMKTWAANNWKTPEGKNKRRKALKQWQQDNPEVVRQRGREQGRKVRLEVFQHYGQRCTCCGESNLAFLTLDHINNDGKQDRESYRGNFYFQVKKRGFPKTLQVMCWNCNQAKRIYGVCPHQSI